MDREQLEYIKENQESLGIEVLSFARRWGSARYGLGADNSVLGTSLEDLAVNVMEDYLQETRRLKPGVPVLIQLKNAVRSKLWSLFKRKEAKAVPLVDEGEDDPPTSYAIDVPGPDEEVGSADDCKLMLQLLWDHPKVKANDEMAAYLMAVEEGASAPAEIAQVSGLPVARVYEARRFLNGIYPEIRRKLNKIEEHCYAK